MKPELYQQCLLYKGNTAMVSWIPTEFAKKGKVVKLKVNGEWDDGWFVMSQFGNKITREQLNTLEAQYKWTRETSDI